jgi:AraC family transcriptional regulator, arabinose operon regulatory protein
MKRLIRWFPADSGRWSSALAVRGLGIHEQMRPIVVDRPGGTNDYLLMHFHSAVEVFVDGSMKPFPPHTFWIWRPGDRHTFGIRENRWDHSWIHCVGSTIAATLETTDVRFAHPLFLSDANLVERYLPAIQEEIQTHPQPDILILENYFLNWIRELQRATDPRKDAHRISQRLTTVRKFIEDNVACPVTLKEMANRANLSISHFSSEFRKSFGTSPIEYVLRLRMQQALYYLRDLNLPISEVASRVGFCDPFYFSKQFKKRCGVSPLNYRKKFFQQPENGILQTKQENFARHRHRSGY